MARRYVNGLNGGYFLSSQHLGDEIRAERAREAQEAARKKREAAERARRESETQRAEREAAIVARGRRELAKRYHPDREPAGAAKMAAVNRIADRLAAGVRRFSASDTAIAREIIAAGRMAPASEVS